MTQPRESATTDAPAFDGARAKAFLGGMVAALNAGALCLMASLGHRTGLFDALADGTALTPAALAERSGCAERYVREWLGAMTTAGVVDTVSTDPWSVRLPAEHAAYLTRAAGPANLAIMAQYIGVLGGVEDAIEARFRSGDGLGYEHYPRFHEVMAETSSASIALSMAAVLPRVEGLTERLDAGIDVLDVGCGRGRALQHLAQRFPRSRFTGLDLSADAVAAGRAECAERGIGNVTLEAQDVTDFDTTAPTDAFDLVLTLDAIHDQAEPQRVLTGIRRALRPGGVYLMQEIAGTSHAHSDVEHPLGTFLYTTSCMHCMAVSLAAGGEGLGAMWGEERARRYLTTAGFTDVSVHALPHDRANSWYVVR